VNKKTKIRCRAVHIHHLLKDKPASPPENKVSILELNEILQDKDKVAGM
jgi:hypothetical protein